MAVFGPGNGLGPSEGVRGALPEPARGGATRLADGATEVPTTQDVAQSQRRRNPVVVAVAFFVGIDATWRQGADSHTRALPTRTTRSDRTARCWSY